MDDLTDARGGARPRRASEQIGEWLGRVGELPVVALCSLLVLAFYFPSLINSSRSSWALYTGDIAGFYLPTIMKVHSLVHHLNLTALDYSIYGGSSDFFLSPNFFTFHPLVVLYGLVMPERDTVASLGRFLTVLFALHSFIALYFTQKIFHRILGLDFGASMFGAIMFALGVHMVDAITQPPFFFVISVFPWAIYAVLASLERPTATKTILASVPIVFGLLGGYIPLSLAGVTFVSGTVGAVLIYGHFSRDAALDVTLRRIVRSALPVVIGMGVCSFYILSLYLFSKDTHSNQAPNLFYSAHQLAEAPSGLLRALSSYWHVPGQMVEFSVIIGLAPLTIVALFLCAPNGFEALRRHELAALLICGGVYVVSVLAIYGSSSVVSAWFFYFLPEIGRMHIYQRLLLFSELAFAVVLTLMLVALTRLKLGVVPRLVFLLLLIGACVGAYLLAYDSAVFTKLGIRPDIVLELLCAALVAIVLAVPSRAFIYVAVIVLAVLPAWGRMYERSGEGVLYDTEAARTPIYLKPDVSHAIAQYMKDHSTRRYVKYADLTPMWNKDGVEPFPKVFPYLVQNDLPLTSYAGFTFYLSSRFDYRQRMPIDGEIRMRPDWMFLKQSGADYAVLDAAEAASGPIAAQLDASKRDQWYPLPGNLVIAPISHAMTDHGSMFDNGMIRVSEISARTNLALHAAVQASEASTPASLATDGNADGDYAHGSVAHTGQDLNAWLDVDLGKSAPIGDVRIWNRTDCCQERMQNAWLFVSDEPFAASDTVATLKDRPGVWARQLLGSASVQVDAAGQSGRYLRLQLDGQEALGNAFLHVAEVQVFAPEQAAAVAPADNPVRSFSSNAANHTKAEIVLSRPAKLEYLFADNPRLTYKIDGKAVHFDSTNGVPTYVLPAGRHSLDIAYHFRPLGIFWAMYAAYWLLVIIVLLCDVGGRFTIVRRAAGALWARTGIKAPSQPLPWARYRAAQRP